MTAELWLLAGSVILALVHISAASLTAKKQTSVAWSIGARDQPRPLTGIAARLDRAQHNFMETWPLFAVAVLLVHLAGKGGWASLLGCHMFLWCRIAYLPAYALGVPWVRTILWNVATSGIVVVLVSLLL